MASDREFLQQVYDLATPEETDAYYTAWAATYDDELTRQGYRTPERCAEALARFLPLDAPILDIGCGTGISGAALADIGFTDLTGQDVNAAMAGRAEASGIYREVRVTPIDAQFDFAPGTYAAITAIGVIGIGAAPPSLLREALAALAPGGHLVFSYNEHALAVPEYPAAIDDALTSGVAEQRFAEHGPHIEGLGSTSTVYVLETR